MEKNLGEQLEELLEKQRLERVTNIGMISDRLFEALCDKHADEIKELITKNKKDGTDIWTVA